MNDMMHNFMCMAIQLDAFLQFNISFNFCFILFQSTGDVGFDEREILRDTTHLEDPLYKNSDMRGDSSLEEGDKTLTNNDSRGSAKGMGIDLPPPEEDGFGDGFMGEWICFCGNYFVALCFCRRSSNCMFVV
jgi:hypothetical protein